METERDQLYEEATFWRSSKKSRRISNDSKLSYTSECQIIHLGVLVRSLSEHSLHICQVVRQIQRDYSMLRSGNSSWVLWSRPQENMFKARKRKQGPILQRHYKSSKIDTTSVKWGRYRLDNLCDDKSKPPFSQCSSTTPFGSGERSNN